MLQGTRDEIAQQVDKLAPGTEELMKKIIDTIDGNRSILTEDDIFNKVLERRSGSQLVIPNSNYYINLSKSTFVVAGLIVSLTTGSPISALIDLFGALFEKPFDLWKLLKANEGQTCILLEAARERNKGITLRHFPMECINNQIECGLRYDGKCCIKEENLESAAEDNLLIKKRGKYYYKDWI